MKKIFTLIATCISIASFAQLVTYNGNGKSGFGGVIGTGTMSITNNGTTVTFTVTKGAGDFNDAMIIYIDSKTGGFGSTSTFNDVADNLRKGVSGYDGTNRSIVNFPTGFTADYAIAIKPTAPDNFGSIYQLAATGSHTYVNTVNLTPNNSISSATYTFSCAKVDIGITGTVAFRFIATYLNPGNAYRSDEAIGFAIAGGNPAYSPVTATSNTVYNNGTAPVTLGYFKGEVKNSNALLSWQTATEINFSHFEIEQSTDGSKWNNIGKVSSSTNGNGANYSFNAGLLTQNSLYRLKMMDKDASFAYSKLVSLKNIYKNKIEILGNPANGVIKVSINNSISTKYSAKLISLEGKILSNTLYNHIGGASTFEMMVPNAVKGLAIVEVNDGTTTQSFKVFIP